ncbi:MAG: metal ABC transporter ATP-binding protein [Candidatus Margulisbacteria bacterium]|jgi:zinc transport system ATP-binding protein|nr:metal ABC transporter ATP-binding protein [Candidatus Margulisiibacteriota bacterium]
MPLLTCQNAAFAYETHTVVSGLNFSVRAGDYLCIVGENGSGKSTLLKGLLRLKTPRTGRVLMADSLQGGALGYLPQQTAAQKDFPASAYEVVLSGRLQSRGLWPFYSRADQAAAGENLRQLGIEELRGRCFRELSGGQQRRVLLARALCAAQKLLLLDEPAAGLDPAAARSLYRLIAKLNKGGLTIIMVSHDLRSALQYASHILHLQNKQLFFGPTRAYLRSGAGKKFRGGRYA